MVDFLIGAAAGLVLGAVIGLLAQQVRSARLRAEVGSLRERAAAAAAATARTAAIEVELAAAVSRGEGLAARLEELKAERAAVERELASLREALASARVDLAARTEALAAEKEQAAGKLALLEEARTRLAEQFKVLAAEALERGGEALSKQHHERLDATLKPLAEQLQRFGRQVQDSYEKGAKDRAGLTGELRQLMQLNRELSEGARNLTRALKGDAQARGQWAEVSLLRILEFAGLRRDHEYRYQEHFGGAEGGQRPDVIVDLPQDRSIVIDSKLNLVSWAAFVEAADEEARTACGRTFVAAVRTHIRQLADKRYQELHGIRTLDFVLMYIPLEAAFVEALARDPALYGDALERNIALVGPSTLLATMRTVAAIWRYDRQEQNAQAIAREAGRMHDKLAGFCEALDEVGQRLDQAAAAWRTADGRLRSGPGNVLRKARHLVELGAKASKRLAGPVDDDEETQDGGETDGAETAEDGDGPAA